MASMSKVSRGFLGFERARDVLRRVLDAENGVLSFVESLSFVLDLLFPRKRRSHFAPSPSPNTILIKLK